jgi:hypothetical protein
MQTRECALVAFDLESVTNLKFEGTANATEMLRPAGRHFPTSVYCIKRVVNSERLRYLESVRHSV